MAKSDVGIWMGISIFSLNKLEKIKRKGRKSALFDEVELRNEKKNNLPILCLITTGL